MTTSHPFGTGITAETLRQTFIPLSQWEDKYRQLILLGKRLPALSDDLKERAKEIAGCENRVWLGIPLMLTVSCTSSAIAKAGLCAVCWRCYSLR
jgi:sulfur transfer protein SufE